MMNTPRYVIINLSKVKDKEKSLKAASEKRNNTWGVPICLTADLSVETLQSGMKFSQ
jgi:hypothetical protein